MTSVISYIIVMGQFASVNVLIWMLEMYTVQ